MIECPTKPLHDALSLARHVTLRNSTIPAYAMVMLQARPENAWLTMTAAGTDCQIALDVEADIEEPLAVCVDADRMALALASPGEKSKLSIDKDGRLKIVTGRSVFRLPASPAEDLPLLLSQGDKIAAFECAWLADSLKRVLPFTGTTDAVRIYVGGVSFSGGDEGVRMNVTTGHVAASLLVPGKIEPFRRMLPRRVCDVLASTAPTRAIVKPATAVFLGENVQITCAYLAAEMPDVTRAIQSKPLIEVDRKEFIETVKTISALSDVQLKSYWVVRLGAIGGELTIEAMTMSGEGRATIPCSDVVWEDHFDAGYLVALASSVGGEKLSLLSNGKGHLGVAEPGFWATVVGQRV